MLNWNDTASWPPASATHGAYPACLHLLIGHGRTVNTFASSRGERCPNCGAHVVFKCAPENEPSGQTVNLTRQEQEAMRRALRRSVRILP